MHGIPFRSSLTPSTLALVGISCVSICLMTAKPQAYIPFSDVSQPYYQYNSVYMFFFCLHYKEERAFDNISQPSDLLSYYM